MNLFLVPIKKFRSVFLQVLIANIMIIGATGFLLRKHVLLIPGFHAGKNLTSPLLVFIVIITIIHSLQQRKHLMNILSIPDFEMRLTQYERFYKKRTIWFLVSVIISCLLCLLSQRIVFFYYAGIDLALSLLFYPGSFLLKKELRSNDIILY